jgi:hypothetical protein
MQIIGVMKKTCRNCKYAHQTFGVGLKEEFQLWECTATLGIPICEGHSNVPISLNHYCDWWNASTEVIIKDVKCLQGRAEEHRKMEKGVCSGRNSCKIM